MRACVRLCGYKCVSMCVCMCVCACLCAFSEGHKPDDWCMWPYTEREVEMWSLI